LSPGDPVAHVELVELIGAGQRLCSWRARSEDGLEATVHAPIKGADDPGAEHFLAVASDLADQQKSSAIEGMLRITAVDPLATAYVGDCAPVGTLTQLAALDWKIDKQLDFAWRLCASLQRMHGAGIIHGYLEPASVLLDESIQPVLANTQAVDVAGECEKDPKVADSFRAFAAPEVRAGSEPDERSDIYSLGRLLHFMLLGEPPHESDEEIPRLDSIAKHPPGLVRIIRKCTTFDPQQRYANVAALRMDVGRCAQDKPVGLRHPDIDDLERYSGTSEAELEKDLSVPPPPKISLRPQKRKEDVAQKLEAKARAGADEEAPAGWSASQAIGFGGVGLLLLIASILAGYYGGKEPLWAFGGALVGAALLGLAPPGYGQNHKLSRTLNVLLFLAACWLLDPVAIAAESSTRYGGLTAPDVAQRVAALGELYAAGDRRFTGLDLTDGDLSGLNLQEVVLDASKLRNAKCTGTDLSKASMLNVDVAGADFSGAKLGEVDATFMKGWELSKCSEATSMPAGWVCSEGAPKLERE
jgi:serine/threonine-protein kinase